MERRDFLAGLAASSAASAGVDQEHSQGASTAPGRPLTVTLLGTGTPAPSLTRQSSGYLIDVGGDLLVWDHGRARITA
jgi:hypothetical protein